MVIWFMIERESEPISLELEMAYQQARKKLLFVQAITSWNSTAVKRQDKKIFLC